MAFFVITKSMCHVNGLYAVRDATNRWCGATCGIRRHVGVGGEGATWGGDGVMWWCVVHMICLALMRSILPLLPALHDIPHITGSQQYVTAPPSPPYPTLNKQTPRNIYERLHITSLFLGSHLLYTNQNISAWLSIKREETQFTTLIRVITTHTRHRHYPSTRTGQLWDIQSNDPSIELQLGVGAMLVWHWRSLGAILAQVWCNIGSVWVQYRHHLGVTLVTFWCNIGAILV